MHRVLSTESPTRVALGLPSHTVFTPWTKWYVSQVVLIALLPRLLDNEKVARARLVYNEVFA